MGADGGSVLSRKDLVVKKSSRTPQKPLNWFQVCSISGKPLDYDQLVCDYYGRLYNKESVLRYLLAKSKTIPQIHTLKDLVTMVPFIEAGRWKCPLSKRDILDENSSTTFACAPCGHIAQTSLIESECPLCKTAVEVPIVLNASGADLDLQKEWLRKYKKERKASRKNQFQG